jgi:hypothetical protein
MGPVVLDGRHCEQVSTRRREHRFGADSMRRMIGRRGQSEKKRQYVEKTEATPGVFCCCPTGNTCKHPYQFVSSSSVAAPACHHFRASHAAVRSVRL